MLLRTVSKLQKKAEKIKTTEDCYLQNRICTKLLPPLKHFTPHVLCLLSIKFPSFQEPTNKYKSFISVIPHLTNHLFICTEGHILWDHRSELLNWWNHVTTVQQIRNNCLKFSHKQKVWASSFFVFQKSSRLFITSISQISPVKHSKSLYPSTKNVVKCANDSNNWKSFNKNIHIHRKPISSHWNKSIPT